LRMYWLLVNYKNLSRSLFFTVSVRSKELEWAGRYWHCKGYQSVWNGIKVWYNFRCRYAIKHF